MALARLTPIIPKKANVGDLQRGIKRADWIRKHGKIHGTPID